MAFYIVVSPQKVYVDYLNGTVLGFSTGQVFDADPALPSVFSMLQANPRPIAPFTPTSAFTAAPAGVPGGAATLDNAGNLTATQLPLFVSRTFTGLAGPGAITVSGAVLGQAVVGIWSLDGSVANAQAGFESSVSVNGQIQQTSGSNYSAKSFAVLLA